MTDAIVVGAGIVGVSIALHLQERGRSVVLIDRKPPGRETSYGNAGIIQAEAVRPRAFPRDIRSLWRAAFNRGLDSRYAIGALPQFAAPLARYWWHSAPARYEQIARDYATLIRHAIPEHDRLVTASGAGNLIRKDGWLLLCRTEELLEKTVADADGAYAVAGVGSETLDAAALRVLEPDLLQPVAGAVRWTDPWTVSNPGSLATAYADLFVRRGGTIKTADALPITAAGSGWSAAGETAADLVIALGPWADKAIRPLGYTLPLFVKRGYHMHYAMQPGTRLNNWMLDSEKGYLLAPMAQGVRLTTGAEFAPLDTPATPVQLDSAEHVARALVPLGARLDPAPWLGARPCTPDMKPVIGPAPRHAHLWFAFGHAHQGLTLGPATGRLVADLVTGATPYVDPAPFRAERFG